MTERKLMPQDLAPGMVLAEPVCHPFTRQVIWTSGTALTQQHITLLQRMELRAIRIIDLADRPRADFEVKGEAAEVLSQAVAPSEPVKSPPKEPPVLRFTRPSAHGTTSTTPTQPARPAAGPTGAPAPRASAKGTQFKPQAIRNEVLERNLQTIKHLHDQVKQSNRIDIQSVDQSVQTTIQRIVTNKELLNSLIDLRVYDEYTYSHSSNVMSLALVVGAAMGYAPERLRILGIGALLHDVGKAMIPESILHKPGKLTEEEFNIMATHPANGIMLLSGYSWATTDIKNVVFQHHEKFDGSGYPMKLSATGISEFARIVSVVDVYDALISDRPYKKGLPPNVVYQAIINGAGNHFDPRIVQAFVKFIVPYPVNCHVELNTGQIARVVRVTRPHLMRPVIELEGNLVDLAKDPRLSIVHMHKPAP
ncbi:MAG TPA: HD domain-containing phosphohydrolase [Pantanalinema sp.]